MWSFMRSVLCLLAAASSVTYFKAQTTSPEKHVPELEAENQAKYPNGYADSKLCRWAKAEDPPYSRMRWAHPDLATFSPSLTDLMQKSDDVVLVGNAVRVVMMLSPSGERGVTYADFRVLRSWKGSHKVGDVVTVASFNTVIHCGPAREEFSGTTVLYEGNARYHAVNPSYGETTFVLFLVHDKTGEFEAMRLAGGEGLQGSFELRPSDILDTKSASSSCLAASLDTFACHSYPHYPQIAPAGCKDEQIDRANITQCIAVLSSSREPMTESGFENDPLRKIYGGNPIANFLKDVQTAAAAAQESASASREGK